MQFVLMASSWAAMIRLSVSFLRSCCLSQCHEEGSAIAVICLLYCPCMTFAVHLSSLTVSLFISSFSLSMTSHFRIPSLAIIFARLVISGLVFSEKYVVRAFSSRLTTSSMLCTPRPPFSLLTYNLSTSPWG